MPFSICISPPLIKKKKTKILKSTKRLLTLPLNKSTFVFSSCEHTLLNKNPTVVTKYFVFNGWKNSHASSARRSVDTNCLCQSKYGLVEKREDIHDQRKRILGSAQLICWRCDPCPEPHDNTSSSVSAATCTTSQTICVVGDKSET